MGLPFVGKLLNKVFGIIDKTVKDKDQAETLKHQLNMAFLNSDLAQMEVNKEEAKHKSIFVAGWRPFIGWVCGVGVAYAAVFQPLAGTFMVYFDPNFDATSLPEIDTSLLITLLTGMLGLGGMRTIERLKGVETNSLKKKGDQ